MSLRKKQEGFSIVEILVSITILSTVSLSIMTMQSSFSKSTTNRYVYDSLNNVANNQMTKCLNRENMDTSPVDTIKSQISESGADVGQNVKVYFTSSITDSSGATANCQPAENTCNNVTIKATNASRNKSVTIQSVVCNFK